MAMVDATFDDLNCMLRLGDTVTSCTTCMKYESCMHAQTWRYGDILHDMHEV